LRTEEKKREKERPSTNPATPTVLVAEDADAKQDVSQVPISHAGPKETPKDLGEKDLDPSRVQKGLDGGTLHAALNTGGSTSVEDKVGGEIPLQH
jgi:hypothetical protein